MILVAGLLPPPFPAHVLSGLLNISMFMGHPEHDAVLSCRSQWFRIRYNPLVDTFSL